MATIVKLNKMIALIFMFALVTINSHALMDFKYVVTKKKNYNFKGKGAKLLASVKDSDGNLFTVLASSGLQVIYFNDSHQNYQESVVNKEGKTLITISKINVQQRIVWSNTVSTNIQAGVTFSDLNISPQGNLALSLVISTPLEGPQGKKWTPTKSDALYLFLNNSDGSIIKDIHISGGRNEQRPSVQFGTGGEVFLKLKSNSAQVKYLNQSYPFKYPSEKISKDLVISLKPNYFTKWSRSVEPSTLVDFKVYKDNLAIMAFNYGKSFGIYKSNGFIKHYKKGKSAGRAAVYAFNKEGYKNWDQVCHHMKHNCSIKNLKVYPNGNIGVHGVFDKTVTFGSQGTISEITLPPKKNGLDYFLMSLNQTGTKENEIIFNSKRRLTIEDNGDNHTLIHFRINEAQLDKPIHYKSTSGGSGTIPFAYDTNCTNHFILNQNLAIGYYEQGGQCFKGSYGQLRLSQGMIKAFIGSPSLTYIEVPYADEKDNDEEIPGLAFKPKFYHGISSLKSKAVLSYAIAPESTEAIVYYPPKGMSQLEYLSNSLVQATLNSTYFRGFTVIVVTSEDYLNKSLLSNYFAPLVKQEYFQEIEKWNVVGYENRASSLVDIYNKNPSSTPPPYFKAKSMALYYPDFKKPSGETEENRANLAAKMPPSFIISGKHEPKVRTYMRELQQTFLEYGTDFSHMHFDGAPLTKRSFSALNSYGEIKSTEIYQKIVKSLCLDNKNYLNSDPKENGFVEKCVKGGLPLPEQEKSEQQAYDDFVQHMKIHYGYKGHTPFLDQEYFEFIGYIEDNHVVAKKKQQGNQNSILK